MITVATLDEIPVIIAMAKQFETFSSHVNVDVEHCIRVYSNFMKSGIGRVFLLKQNDAIVGGLGAIKAPDLHTGCLMAIECFWFVSPGHRGGGLKLLESFEAWAREEGCVKAAMIHLEDSQPGPLEKIYARRGYLLAERHYIKEIQP